MEATPKKIQKLIELEADYGNVDPALEPHTLTDKDQVKVVGCRVCKRPCIVTQFASPAKTACHDHREREHTDEAMREFDDSLEPHVLTDKPKTKDVPCRACGRRCTVTTFATPQKVACNDCRKSTRRVARVKETVDSNGRVTREVSHVVIDEDYIKESLRPTVPFWPAGSDEDRATLLDLTLAQYRQEQVVTNERDRFREGPYAEWKSIRKWIKISENEGEWEPEAPPHDEGLVGAIEELNIIKSQRMTQRQAMVDKLVKDEAHNPYAEDTTGEGERAAKALAGFIG